MAFVFQFFVSPHLATFVLSVVPPVSILAVLYGRYLRKLSKRTQDSLAQATQVKAPSRGGLRCVASAGAPAGRPRATRSGCSESTDPSSQGTLGPRSLEHAAFLAGGPPTRHSQPSLPGLRGHMLVLTTTVPRGTRKLTAP